MIFHLHISRGQMIASLLLLFLLPLLLLLFIAVVVIFVATGKIFIHKKRWTLVGVSQRARKTIKRQEGEEEEEEATAEAAETTLAQADKQAYKLTAKEREREG